MIDEQNTTTQPETTEVNYIEAIAEMRKNTVSKEEYNKVVEENKKLVKAMVNGETMEFSQPEPEIDLNELRNSLFNQDNTNLAFAEKSLQLRNELIRRGERDPFVPYGHQYLPNEADYLNAEKAAEALQHCIDVADGDPAIFQNELQRIMVDTIPNVGKKSNNRR